MILEPEQEELLVRMVEAEHDVSRSDRNWLLLDLDQAEFLRGPWGTQPVLARDVRALAKAGLLDPTGGIGYVVTGEGRAYYARLKERVGQPAARMEEEMRRFLDADRFRETYPEAYARWSEAEALLWGSDSDKEFSTIGHKNREAVQAFASTLVGRYSPADVDPDPQKVKRRLGAVVAMMLPQLGERRAELLKAMADYWEATVDLIQRQEHAGQREADPLTWLDGRRVVFHTAALMFEFAVTVEQVAAS